MTIQLPADTVRVGYTTYQLLEMNQREAQCTQNYGVSSHVERFIKVDLAHGAVKAANILLHELLHCMYRHGAISDIESPSEEQVVRQVSDMLSQIWQDNPQVMEWIGANLQAAPDA